MLKSEHDKLKLYRCEFEPVWNYSSDNLNYLNN
jgi:hypothetical protein